MSLRQDTIRIDTKDCEVKLVGVYHRYQQSIWDVEDIISEENQGLSVLSFHLMTTSNSYKLDPILRQSLKSP